MAKRYHIWYNQRCDRGRGKESGILLLLLLLLSLITVITTPGPNKYNGNKVTLDSSELESLYWMHFFLTERRCYPSAE